MLYLKKTTSPILSCHHFDSKTEGIYIGLDNKKSIASLIEKNGKIILQINKPQCEAQNIEISFVNDDWEPIVIPNKKTTFVNNGIDYKLTPTGIQKIEKFLEDLKMAQCEVVASGKDTANDCTLPNFNDIINLMEKSNFHKLFIASYIVSDNNIANETITLIYKEDFVQYDPF